MGLDLVLGGLVLVMAVWGWLKGFILQAIRLEVRCGPYHWRRYDPRRHRHLEARRVGGGLPAGPGLRPGDVPA